MDKKNIILKFLYNVFFYTKKLLSLFFYKYRYFKFNNLEDQVKINLDSLYFYYYTLLSKIKKSGVCYERKISSKCTPHPNTNDDNDNTMAAYTTIDLSNSEILYEERPLNGNKIKNGYYIMNVSNLIQDREYILSIIPLIDLVSSHRFDGTAGTKYEDSTLSSSTGGNDNENYRNTVVSRDGNLRTPLPKSIEIERYYSPPYFVNKNSTQLNISIIEDGEEYRCANLLSEYCEIGSIQGSLFYYDNSYHYNLTNVSGRLNLNHIYGGKGFSSSPFYIKFRTRNEDHVKIRIFIGSIENVSTNEDVSYSCLNELVLRVESSSQVKYIKDTSTKDINNPEIEYGDGGERYYEPWKFWIEGDLKSDAQGNNSWYKKWKSWFKEKIRIHNKWIENPNRTDIEEDIDAFKEETTYKQDHL